MIVTRNCSGCNIKRKMKKDLEKYLANIMEMTFIPAEPISSEITLYNFPNLVRLQYVNVIFTWLYII